ncbi:MAG: hypothetical protein M3Q27_13555 [Actinomycetota bacterium]|nr:hypothetical protein [Actinomycetota bacterium]
MARASLAAAVEPEQVTPGLLGFAVFVGLILATWALLRSMNRQLQRISFDDGSGAPGEDASGLNARPAAGSAPGSAPATTPDPGDTAAPGPADAPPPGTGPTQGGDSPR